MVAVYWSIFLLSVLVCENVAVVLASAISPAQNTTGMCINGSRHILTTKKYHKCMTEKSMQQ